MHDSAESPGLFNLPSYFSYNGLYEALSGHGQTSLIISDYGKERGSQRDEKSAAKEVKLPTMRRYSLAWEKQVVAHCQPLGAGSCLGVAR